MEAEAEKARETMHATAFSAATLAKKAGVKKLVLTHVGNRYEPREPVLKESQSVFPASELAHEGKEWMI